MLTSLQNPLVKHMRKLQRAKYRKQHQLLLLEGTHLIQEASTVFWPLEVVCCTPQWITKYPTLYQTLRMQSPRIEQVSLELLAAISTTQTPDGVVAIARSRTTNTSDQTSSSKSPHHPGIPLGLVLDTLQDPGNLGTMIRTAAAAGASHLLLSSDSVDPEHPKVLRASAGSWFHLPITSSHTLAQDLQTYQQQGIQIIATRADAPQTYWQLDLQQPTFILIGNEGAGLSSTLLDVANHHVAIPMVPQVESLNAATTAALLLYEARRQRQSLEHEPHPS